MSVSFLLQFFDKEKRKSISIPSRIPSFSFMVNNTNKREAILKRKGLFVIDRGDPEK